MWAASLRHPCQVNYNQPVARFQLLASGAFLGSPQVHSVLYAVLDAYQPGSIQFHLMITPALTLPELGYPEHRG
jgi:hypothetical protein